MLALTSFKRSLIAIVISVALIGAMLKHRSQLREAEHEVVFSLSSSMWKVSELVYEAQRFATAASDMAKLGIGVEDFQLRFDILWSRVDIVSGIGFQDRPYVRQPVEDLEAWRARWDPVIFSEPPFAPEQLLQMRQELDGIVVDLRRGWIRDFESAGFNTWASAASTTERDIARREWIIAMLLALITVYFAAEVFFAMRATGRERSLREMADRASRFKSDFIANVSHEIRTPLNGIIGMAAHLAEQPMAKDQRDCLAVIQDSGDLLLSTINDVLDLSKIEAEQMSVQSDVFDPMRGIELARALYVDVARNKGISLELAFPNGPLPKLEGDERRLRQVLNNLVSNAIKFTEHGRVELRAWYGHAQGAPPDAQDGPPGLYIVVSDTGPGIAAHLQKRIFEPFVQDAKGLQRGSAGTGLGLTISRALCEAMGGSLRMESVLGEGTQFFVSVPLERVESVPLHMKTPSSEAHKIAPEIAGMRIMIVDDNKTNRFVLRKMLERAGAEVLEAASGREALEELATERVLAVLMDVQMPGMNGVETTARFLEAEALAERAPPPVIGVTANVMADQVASYKAAGMVEVLAKPVSKDLLIATLAKHVGPADGGQDAQAAHLARGS